MRIRTTARRDLLTINKIIKSGMKFYFLSGILFLAVYFFQFKQSSLIDRLIENGITEKVLIIDKTEDCLSSTRNRNRATVVTKNAGQFKIDISYKDCIKLQKVDSILIRYLEGSHEVLRVYDYNKPARKSMRFDFISC